MKTPEERAAYYKGKYDALKEKISDTGSMVKQSIIDHTVRYVLIALFLAGGAFGTYYYVSHKVTETVIEIKQDVKDSIPHPIEATKKWLKKDHWWNKKEANETVHVVKTTKNTTFVAKKSQEVSQDNNNVSLIYKAKEKLLSWKFWAKEENNEK
jgi:hypothetical protein